MSKFNFQLNSILRLREVERDRRRMQLADTQRADMKLSQQIADLDAQRKAVQHACRQSAGPGIVDVRRLADNQQYSGSLRILQAELRRQRESLSIEIQRRRRDLVEADRSVRTLEKLRDNQFQAHHIEQQHCQEKQLDDFTTTATYVAQSSYEHV